MNVNLRSVLHCVPNKIVGRKDIMAADKGIGVFIHPYGGSLLSIQ